MGERAQAEVAERVGHTPGPWRMSYSPIFGLDVTSFDGVVDACGHKIVAMGLALAMNARDDREIMANTHLIAAAPDMLAALREVLPLCEYAYSFPDSDVSWRDHIAHIRAAIAKAEGR